MAGCSGSTRQPRKDRSRISRESRLIRNITHSGGQVDCFYSRWTARYTPSFSPRNPATRYMEFCTGSTQIPRTPTQVSIGPDWTDPTGQCIGIPCTLKVLQGIHLGTKVESIVPAPRGVTLSWQWQAKVASIFPHEAVLNHLVPLPFLRLSLCRCI